MQAGGYQTPNLPLKISKTISNVQSPSRRSIPPAITKKRLKYGNCNLQNCYGENNVRSISIYRMWDSKNIFGKRIVGN
jgi:hypothetical protein